MARLLMTANMRPRAGIAAVRRAAATAMRAAAQSGAAILRGDGKLLVGLVALGALLRLVSLDLIGLGPATTELLLSARDAARGVEFPLVGPPAGFGLHHPPLATYLLAGVALLSADPRAAVVALVALHATSTVALYLLARRHYGVRAAFAAALLWAANPWSVLAARAPSPAAFVGPLAVAALGGTLLGVVRRNPWGWVLAAGALGLSVAASLSALALVPALALVVLLYRRRVAWAHLLLGICVALLVLSPYLYRQNLERFGAFASALREWSGAGPLGGRIGGLGGLADVTLPSLGLNGATAAWDDAASPAAERARAVEGAAAWLALAAFAAVWPLALRSWARWKERRDPARLVVVGAYLWVPLLALTLSPGALEPGRAAALQPVGVLAVAVALDALAGAWHAGPGTSRLGPLVWALAGGLVLGAAVGWQTYGVLETYRHVGVRDAGADYGLPYRFWARTAALVRREAAAAGSRQVWILPSEGVDPAALDLVLGDALRRVWLGEGALLLPAGRPGLYLRVREAGNAPASSAPDDAVAGEAGAPSALVEPPGEPAGLVLSPGRGYRAELSVAEAQRVDEVLDAIASETLEDLGGGLVLMGYDWPTTLPRPGDRVVLDTYWTFRDIPDDERSRAHRLIVELVGAEGETIAAAEGLGLPEVAWAEGYLLRQSHALELPESLDTGEYTLRIRLLRDGEESTAVLGPVSVGA